MKRTAPLVGLLALTLGMGAVAWRLVRSGSGQAAAPGVSEAAAASMDRKIAAIVEHDAKRPPGPLVTVLTEDEINSYLRYRLVPKTPKGVYDVKLSLHNNRPSGTCLVDFDEIKAASRKPVNPLLDYLLAGRKPVAAAGTLTSENGTAVFHLEEVTIGGTTLNGFLLDLLVKHFVQPRYPKAAINRPFRLPAGIDRIAVGERHAVVYQK